MCVAFICLFCKFASGYLWSNSNYTEESMLRAKEEENMIMTIAKQKKTKKIKN